MAFRDEMFKEAAEAVVHETMADAVRSAAAAGESDKSIAKRVLKALADPNGPVMTFAQSLPGFALPILGAALAHLLGKSGFVDKILPDDARPAVRQAKFIIKTVGPGVLIGALSGLRDAAQDIDREIDKVRSDSTIADDQAVKGLDWVVMSQLMPGRIFVPGRDSDGNVRYGRDGVPIVLNPDWTSYKAMWDSTHKSTTRQVSGGKGKPPRTVTDPADAFPWELLKLSEAVARVGDTGAIASADLEQLKVLTAPSKSWGSKLSPRAHRWLFALALTRSRQDPMAQTESEDFFKDLPGKADIALIEDIAERQEASILPDSSLPQAEYETAISYIDSFLGAELTWQNKLLRLGSRIWRGRGRMNPTFRNVLVGIGWATVIFNVLQVALFLLAFWWMIKSMFSEPSWFHAMRTIGSATVIIVMLFTLRIWQRLGSPIFVGLLKMPTEYLAEFGWKFTFILLPVYIIGFALIPEIGISMIARVLILMLAFVSLCRGMGYKSAGVPAKAQLLAIKGADYGWLVAIGIVAIDWMVRQAWPSATGGWIAGVASIVWLHINANQWVASALLFALVFFPGMLLVRRMYRSRSVTATTVTITQHRHGFATLLVFLIALIVAISVPWFSKTRHEYDPLAVKSSAASTTASPVAPVTIDTPAPTTSTSRRSSHGHTHSGQIDCDRLSDAGKVAYGCP